MVIIMVFFLWLNLYATLNETDHSFTYMHVGHRSVMGTSRAQVSCVCDRHTVTREHAESSWKGYRGAIHWTKITRLRFENFFVSNGSRQVRTVSFHMHSARKTSFALIYNEGCWITVARIKVRWRFRRWYCVSCFIHSNLTSTTGYFEQTFPRFLPYD